MENRVRKADSGGELDLPGYYPALLAYFRARLSQRLRNDADDLAQETLLAALRHQASGGEPIRNTSAFLRDIAHKKLQGHLRSDQRRQRKEEAFLRDQDGFIQRVAHAAAQSHLEEERRQKALSEALKLLSRDEMEILLLRCGTEEVRNADAARQLGISAPDASRRFYRVRQKLYKALRADSSEGTP